MIGLFLALSWIALVAVAGIVIGVVRDHESPFTRRFWT